MIFLVEDNEGIRETLRAYLELAGFHIKEFAGADGVLEAFSYTMPDLCILDIMLPDGNGFVLAKKIAHEYPDAAFLFLTARESESDRITGFELGAEDYIIKPFSPRELVLRVQAILRRLGKADTKTGIEKAHIWELDEHRLILDTESHTVDMDSKRINLTAVEWNILTFLSGNAGIVLSRERILGECLEYYHDGSERTVNTHLKNIRAKLDGLPWIETIRGFGYRFAGKPVKNQ